MEVGWDSQSDATPDVAPNAVVLAIALPEILSSRKAVSYLAPISDSAVLWVWLYFLFGLICYPFLVSLDRKLFAKSFMAQQTIFTGWPLAWMSLSCACEKSYIYIPALEMLISIAMKRISGCTAFCTVASPNSAML